jgi:HAD superfamily hydrolase (TIGR01484 family)
MLKIAAFDMDGTLSRPNRPLRKSVGERLRALEERGLTIVIASGKNCPYLRRQARRARLQRPIIIAENGCVVFTPSQLDARSLSREASVRGRRGAFVLTRKPPAAVALERYLSSNYGGRIRLQSNLVEVTAFPKELALIPRIAREARRVAAGRLTIVAHDEAVDAFPVGVNKGKALRFVQRALRVPPRRTIAVGNSTNDISLFHRSRVVYIVGPELKYPGARYASSIEQVLTELSGWLRDSAPATKHRK